MDAEKSLKWQKVFICQNENHMLFYMQTEITAALLH
jgi:hypothetical protein